jgi:hypothetical protein
VDVLQVVWPGGAVSEWFNVAPDQVLTLSDGGSPGNSNPVVNISAPADGTTVTVADSVDFAAVASDAEDGNLTGGLEWRSDRDGLIGMGGTFSTSALSAGNHVVTASVMDSGGLSGSANVNLTVKSAATGEVTLSASQDTFTDPTDPTANRGRWADLKVTRNGARTTFVQFDLAPLSGAANSGTLQFRVLKVNWPGNVYVHRVTGAWEEYTLTDANRPPIDPIPFAVIPIAAGDGGKTLSFDVSAVLQAWQVTPSTNHGLAFVPDQDKAVNLAMSSREGIQPMVVVSD